MNDKNTGAKLLVYHATIEEDLHLWELSVKASLRGKDLMEALEEGPVEKKTSEKDLTIVISALDDDFI